MGLTTRVNRLERIAGPPPLPGCPRCGVPTGRVATFRVVLESRFTEPACPDCGFPLNSRGYPLPSAPPGSPVLRVEVEPPVVTTGVRLSPVPGR